MRSSAGSPSPELRSGLWLATVPLAALVVSLLLALVVAMLLRSHANDVSARGEGTPVRSSVMANAAPGRNAATVPNAVAVPNAATVPNAGTAANAAAAPNAAAVAPSSAVDQNAPLWTLLARPALAVDALAAFGLAVMLAVRFRVRRRRGARP